MLEEVAFYYRKPVQEIENLKTEDIIRVYFRIQKEKKMRGCPLIG